MTMNVINKVLTFPGSIAADFLSAHLGIFCLSLSCLIILLLTCWRRYKKEEFLNIALICTSLFLAVIPVLFGFAAIESKLFWSCIIAASIIGFIYYLFIHEKEDALSLPLQSYKKTDLIYFVVLICGLTLYLRFFLLEHYPAGYSVWELFTNLELIKYDTGQLDLKSYLSLFGKRQVNGANESPIIMALAFPFHKIFGVSLASSRYFSVMWGLAGLIFLFLYLREHFSKNAAVFLIAFTSLELVNVTFSRAFSFYITSFTYTAFALYLMEATFKQKRLRVRLLFAFLLALVVFGSNYVYLVTKSLMLIITVLLGYKVLFKKSFLAQHIISLGVYSVTFLLAIYIYTDGNLRALWPSYTTYISLDKNTPLPAFAAQLFETSANNISWIFNKIVFIERAVDSLSVYKNGGLVSGLTLCFIPFAVGFVIAGIRREKYFALFTITLLSVLPAIFSGIPKAIFSGAPNARRLLLFLSFLLVFAGITVYLLFVQLRRLFAGRMEKVPLIVVSFLFLILFSYNLFIFIDINNNMRKKNSVVIPFADSGFADMRYSRYATALARDVGGYLENNNVYVYYSYIFDENATAPNGLYQQFLVEGYKNIHGGRKLIWMNSFNHIERLFYKYEAAVRLILNSDLDVKVIFVKPLADEVSICERLKAFFPYSVMEERTGDTDEDKFYILSIPHSKIKEAVNGHVKTNKDKPVQVHTNRVWAQEKLVTVPAHLPRPHAFWCAEDDKCLYSYFNRVSDSSGLMMLSEGAGSVTKFLMTDGKTYELSYLNLTQGLFTVYGADGKKIKEIPLDGYLFDLFFGNRGEMYITYLNKNKITIIDRDYSEKTWDTSTFSKYPIWNGAMDEKGDIILLSGGSRVYIFDRNMKLYSSFNVDASWSVYPDLIRNSGGVIALDNIIYVLDSLGKAVNTYNKNGNLIYNHAGYPYFRIPSDFTAVHIQRLNNRIILAGINDKGKTQIYWYGIKN